MFAALSGVASFHRACLLAQDFTHVPACQTGESAPQGRFRHQPEQMVHPPFAWQLASFPSLPVCGEEAPYCPLRDFATLRAYSPEIKAQQAIFAFLPVYPELVGVVGSRVPDYRGRFLRGLQSGYSVGQTVANSLKSHNHTQPTHTHSFSGQLVSTALSGTAAVQSFSSAANLGVSGWAAGQSITSGGAGGQTYQAVQSSGGTWISISQTGNDSGIAGGRVSIQRTTEEALKGTSPFGDRNTLVAPGVYESSSGGGCRVHCRWFFHSSRNDFRRFDLGQHRRRKHFRYGQWHSKRNDQCQRRFWGTSKWKYKRKYRCRWGNPYRLYGRSRDSS